MFIPANRYNYEQQKPGLFDDIGQRRVIAVRDHVLSTLHISGAITMARAMDGAGTGDTYAQMAAVDRLVELGDIEEVALAKVPMGQHRIFRLPYTG